MNLNTYFHLLYLKQIGNVFKIFPFIAFYKFPKLQKTIKNDEKNFPIYKGKACNCNDMGEKQHFIAQKKIVRQHS